MYNEQLGFRLASTDIDNDERDDLAISKGGTANTPLFYGALQSCTDGNGNSRDCRSDDAQANFGATTYAVAKAGDQNNDGFEDLLILSDNKKDIYLFYGADNGP